MRQPALLVARLLPSIMVSRASPARVHSDTRRMPKNHILNFSDYRFAWFKVSLQRNKQFPEKVAFREFDFSATHRKVKIKVVGPLSVFIGFVTFKKTHTENDTFPACQQERSGSNGPQQRREPSASRTNRVVRRRALCAWTILVRKLFLGR